MLAMQAMTSVTYSQGSLALVCVDEVSLARSERENAGMGSVITARSDAVTEEVKER